MHHNMINAHNLDSPAIVIALPPIQSYFETGSSGYAHRYDRSSQFPTSIAIRRGRKCRTSVMKAKNRVSAQWLFFNESRWIPLDLANNKKLENTIFTRGTFIDIQDSHFPEVRRVRVFPELDYLSYLGIRYKISRVLLPC